MHSFTFFDLISLRLREALIINERGSNMFYVIVRSSIHSKAEEFEYQTEAEAIDEALKFLKRGDLVEIAEE